ncbi:MAG TPA: STAS domain-containing protein [Acidobacteriota bacterium]|nr:STAS domain-containing protein [Acidobacteriota bacterium]
MNLGFIKDGDYGILSFSGNMEKLSIVELKKGIDLVVEHACSFMVVDLCRVTHLSVSSLGLIFASKNRLEDIGTLTAIVGPRRELNKLLSADSMEKMVPLCENIERAKIALRKLAFEKKSKLRRRSWD